MKICSVIAEYNPFHNGHLRQLNYIKDVIRPDYTVVFLSGNFTQRAEPSMIDKFKRAKHAVACGADAVIELPSVFATQSAEFFASGAVKLINSLPYEKSVCFGVESGTCEDFTAVSNLLANETEEFSAIVKKELNAGVSLITARETALKSLLGDKANLITSPNNVLGVEYVKAIIKNGYDITPIPIIRNGQGYNDGGCVQSLPSALSIRNAVSSGDLTSVSNAVPSVVLSDIPPCLPSAEKEILYAVISTDKAVIKQTADCAEGLENRIKSAVKTAVSLDELIEKLKTKRYTTARLKRILLSTATGINLSLIRSALASDLYLKVLAINGNKPEILGVLAKSTYPVITRKSDVEKLTGTALKVFEKDVFCNDFYSKLIGTPLNENTMLIVK